MAILGDMGELGENEISLHKEVGEHAAKCGIDVCICVGELSVHMADAARTADPNFEVHYEKDQMCIRDRYRCREEYRLGVLPSLFSPLLIRF